MRTQAEIRRALATLEKAVAFFPEGTTEGDVMAGEIAGLRYALGDERTEPSLEDTLPKMQEILNELDPARN